MPGGDFRPDATAWAVLFLRNQASHADSIQRSCKHLVESQLPDGRVPVSRNHPEAFWPTALAIMAWQGLPEFYHSRKKALGFITNTVGRHWEKQDDLVGHDTSIPGWPWISGTHSWITPTTLGMLALQAQGKSDHPRIKEGARMLVNRQLKEGGWNFGNTTVFGQSLRPFPETTGMALVGLAGLVSLDTVRASIAYLSEEIITLRTPLALSWALLGLRAWGRPPERESLWIQETVGRESLFGTYDTSSLSLLGLAALGEEGLNCIGVRAITVLAPSGQPLR